MKYSLIRKFPHRHNPSEGWDVNSYLFCVKTSNKEEGMIALPFDWGGSAKAEFIVWISWKNVNNLFGTHAYRKTRTENFWFE